jgi:hypothetical protein
MLRTMVAETSCSLTRIALLLLAIGFYVSSRAVEVEPAPTSPPADGIVVVDGRAFAVVRVVGVDSLNMNRRNELHYRFEIDDPLALVPRLAHGNACEGDYLGETYFVAELRLVPRVVAVLGRTWYLADVLRMAPAADLETARRMLREPVAALQTSPITFDPDRTFCF